MKQNLTAVTLLCFILMLNASISFSQNQSNGSILTTISPVAPAPVGSTEAFRFRAGIITQLENQGTSLFGFSAADQWHSIGRINGAAQTVTGFRAQRAGRGLLLGFDGGLQSGATPTLGDPIVQWGGNSGISITPGDLLFRSFTSPTSTTTTTRFRIGGNGNAFAQNGLLGHFENGTFGDITGTAGQWISAGRFNGAAQTLYGTRIQRAGRALVTGFDGPLQTGATPTLGDAFIQWIGNNTSSVTPGNLDFRVADNPTSATPRQVLRLTSGGSVIISSSGVSTGNLLTVDAGTITSTQPFGIRSTASMNISNSYNEGIVSELTSSNNSATLVGMYGRVTNSAPAPGVNESYGVYGFSANNGSVSCGVVGETLGGAAAQYGVWGLATSGFAGYFDGVVYASGGYQQPSDRKLKRNITSEEKITDKILRLNPVNYYYQEAATRELNMPKTFQHGFIAQEVEQLFPEMITEVTAPVLAERSKSGGERKVERMEQFKSINYTMLIPILTKAIQEQQQTIEEMRTEIASLRSTQLQAKALNSGYTLSQNVPNPFSDNTTISFTLPNTTDRAILMVTDLNGKMLLQYNLSKGSNQQVISGNTLTAGIYVYSLIINGNEMISKRMVLTK